MPTSLLIGAATAGASALFNNAFGDHRDATSPLQNFSPPGFSGGGLSATFNGNGFNVTPGADRTGLVSGLSNTFGANADALAGLRGSVAPGVSDLRAARLAEIENARTSAVGNLRDNLARRRVLGSSFAQDAVTRAESEFGQQKERVAAESFMQELEMTQNLLQQEFATRRAAFQTGLDELNLEAQIGTALAGKATDVLGKNAQTEAQLIALNQQGAGKFFGQMIAPGIQKGISGLNFGGGGGGGGDVGQVLPINAFVGPV
jgi:hypothetical protein